MFYYHIGNRSKSEAKEICSQFGDSVHLPIPRSKEENYFYQTFFTDDNLWLDISFDLSENTFKSDSGSVFANKVITMNGIQTVSSFDWISFNNSTFDDVILSSDGVWKTAEASESLTSVCIHKIKHDNDCSKCFDEDFCQYTNKTRQEIECICPVNRNGERCQSFDCDCKNEGYCRWNNELKTTECVCLIPFSGPKCELGNVIIKAEYSYKYV